MADQSVRQSIKKAIQAHTQQDSDEAEYNNSGAAAAVRLVGGLAGGLFVRKIRRFNLGPGKDLLADYAPAVGLTYGAINSVSGINEAKRKIKERQDRRMRK